MAIDDTSETSGSLKDFTLVLVLAGVGACCALVYVVVYLFGWGKGSGKSTRLLMEDKERERYEEEKLAHEAESRRTSLRAQISEEEVNKYAIGDEVQVEQRRESLNNAPISEEASEDLGEEEDFEAFQGRVEEEDEEGAEAGKLVGGEVGDVTEGQVEIKENRTEI